MCAGISVQHEGWHFYLGHSTGAHLGLPRGSLPRLVQGKENQNSEAELFHTHICNFSLMLLFALRLHRLNLVHAKKGPVLTLPPIPA